MVSNDDNSSVSVDGKPESVAAVFSDSGDDSGDDDDDPSVAADGKELL